MALLLTFLTINFVHNGLLLQTITHSIYIYILVTLDTLKEQKKIFMQ